MKYRVVSIAELDEALVGRWSAIQRASPIYASPYFRPEFAQALGAVRKDLRVCVLEEEGCAVGFFPFQRSFLGGGRAAGIGLSDYQGVVVRPEAQWCPRDLMKACDLDWWEFDHLLADQSQWHPFFNAIAPSPIIDTAQSFNDFLAVKRKTLATPLRRRRKLIKELGSFEFELVRSDPLLLGEMIRWKSEQCQRSGSVDIFSFAWTVELLQRILATQSDDFGGVLSALWLGEELAAVHFGIRSRNVLHYWFPAYNVKFRQYSPGLILLLELVRWACENDEIYYIDLGKDLSQYKQEFMTGSIAVAQGCATLFKLVQGWHWLKNRAVALAEDESAPALFRFPGRIVRRRMRSARFR